MDAAALRTRVLAYRGQPETATGPDATVTGPVCEAVAAFVDALPSIRRAKDGTWAPQTIHGAVMLAARLIARRNSPSGLESFGVDGSSYVARFDPDIEQLLRIGRHAAPRVG